MEKQLLKHLYRHLGKIITDHNQRDYEIFERADRIVIWIVGFSIGVFVLLISQDYNDSLPIPVNEVVISALIIVMLGLVYRILSFFAAYALTQININFISHVELAANFPELPNCRQLKESDSLEDIIFYLKEDFTYIVDKDYSSATPEQKNELKGLYKKFYESIAESNDIEAQLNEFDSTVARFYGLNLAKRNQKKSKDKTRRIGRAYRILLVSSYIFFFLTISCFIIITCYVLVHFINQL